MSAGPFRQEVLLLSPGLFYIAIKKVEFVIVCRSALRWSCSQRVHGGHQSEAHPQGQRHMRLVMDTAIAMMPFGTAVTRPDAGAVVR